MGRYSGIAWTDHTANAWWGCQEVSPACDHCYARQWDHVMGGDHWAGSRLRIHGFAHAIKTWDKEARRAGTFDRVFIQSMSDLFERFEGPITERRNKVERIVPGMSLNLLRAEVWKILRPTTNLVFLLLTKRPENIREMLPEEFWGDERIWLGTTVENAAYLDRLDTLLRIPAVVHFASVEPQLADLSLASYLGPEKINWVISGGESKQEKDHVPRPFHIEWPRDLAMECRRDGAAFFMKQMGSNVCDVNAALGRDSGWPDGTSIDALSGRVRLRDAKGGDPSEWPADLRVQELPDRFLKHLV